MPEKKKKKLYNPFEETQGTVDRRLIDFLAESNQSFGGGANLAEIISAGRVNPAMFHRVGQGNPVDIANPPTLGGPAFAEPRMAMSPFLAGTGIASSTATPNGTNNAVPGANLSTKNPAVNTPRLPAGGQKTAVPVPMSTPTVSTAADRASINPFDTAYKSQAPETVGTSAGEPAPAKRSVNFNNLAYILGGAAKAIMGPFDQSPAAQIGGMVQQVSQGSEFNKSMKSALAGELPDADTFTILSPEQQTQVRDTADRSMATKHQMEMDDLKYQMELSKLDLDEAASQQRLQEHRDEMGFRTATTPTVADIKGENKLNRATQERVATIYGNDRNIPNAQQTTLLLPEAYDRATEIVLKEQAAGTLLPENVEARRQYLIRLYTTGVIPPDTTTGKKPAGNAFDAALPYLNR